VRRSKFHFHTCVEYIFSQSVTILSLILTITNSFSTLDSLFVLYITLVRPKFAYASTVWNSIMSTDALKLKRIQRKFVVLCQYHLLNFWSFVVCTIKDFILMLYFLFLFIHVYNVARLFWLLLVFEFFLTILETPPCFLLLVKTLRLLDVFRLLTVCEQISLSLGNPLLFKNRFCGSLWNF
jgi:hypothetical protein